MAITFVQQKNKQKKMILVFILVLLITLFILWRGGDNKGKTYGPSPVTSNEYVSSVKIDFDVLGGSLLNGFRDFVDIVPLEETSESEAIEGEMTEESGRDNPFLPY